MKITKRDNDELNKLIKKGISDNSLEFEARITEEITENKYNDLLNGLLFSKKRGGQGLKYIITSTLSISNETDTVRINIVGQDRVSHFGYIE